MTADVVKVAGELATRTWLGVQSLALEGFLIEGDEVALVEGRR